VCRPACARVACMLLRLQKTHRQASMSAGLSCRRKPFRNQWMETAILWLSAASSCWCDEDEEEARSAAGGVLGVGWGGWGGRWNASIVVGTRASKSSTSSRAMARGMQCRPSPLDRSMAQRACACVDVYMGIEA